MPRIGRFTDVWGAPFILSTLCICPALLRFVNQVVFICHLYLVLEYGTRGFRIAALWKTLPRLVSAFRCAFGVYLWSFLVGSNDRLTKSDLHKGKAERLGLGWKWNRQT